MCSSQHSCGPRSKLGFRYSGSGSGSGSGFRFRSRRDRNSGSVPADALSRPMNVTLTQHVRVARDSVPLLCYPALRTIWPGSGDLMSARSRSQTTTGLTFICLCVALMQEAAARAPETETVGDVWSVMIEPSYWRDGALIPRPPDSGSGDRNSVNSTGTPEFRSRSGPGDRNSTGTPNLGPSCLAR